MGFSYDVLLMPDMSKDVWYELQKKKKSNAKGGIGIGEFNFLDMRL